MMTDREREKLILEMEKAARIVKEKFSDEQIEKLKAENRAFERENTIRDLLRATPLGKREGGKDESP